MESGIQSSFIPKDAGKAAPTPRLERGGGLSDLILLIAIVMFVASAALAGAVFLYKQYLESSSMSKVEQLKRAQQAFEPALIEQLTRLDDRMRAADGVLTAHLAPTVFFQALSQATLQTISFQSLDLEAGDPKHITIKMQGVAQSVNSIALEADLMSKNGVVTSPIFSNISRQPDGVHFDVSALINPSAISYISYITQVSGASQGLEQPAQPAGQTQQPLQQVQQPASQTQNSAQTGSQQPQTQPQPVPQALPQTPTQKQPTQQSAPQPAPATQKIPAVKTTND